MLAGRGLWLVAVMVTGSSCGGAPRPASPAADGQGRKIRKVDIRGNSSVSDDALLAGLATRPPTGRVFLSWTTFDPIELQRDRTRIESYYHQRGYFSARVLAANVRRIGTSQIDVTIAINEGPRTVVRSLNVVADSPVVGVTNSRLERAAGMGPGDPMVYADYERAKRLVRARLLKVGYAFATVAGTVSVDRRKAVADVQIRVDAGPRATFGQTRVIGLRTIPESAVRARLKWKPGQTFDTDRLRRAQRHLYSLGVFGTVSMDYAKKNRPEVADITVRVREGARHEVKLGGGGGIDRTRYEIRGRSSYVERGFFRPLWTLRLDARPAYSFLRGVGGVSGFGGEASAGLTKDDFLLPLFQAGAQVTYAAREFNAYSIQGPRLALNVNRRFLDDRLRVAVAWQFRLQSFFRVDDDVTDVDRTDLGIETPYRLAFFEQSIAYDGRDNPISPRSGVYAELRMEEAGAYALGEFSYVRAMPEVRVYLPLGARIVVASRLRFGSTLRGAVLPITQRFMAGGASSQRGFSLQRLSPRAGDMLDTAPVGGKSLFLTNAEVRLDALRLAGNWLGIVAFLDGGDVQRNKLDVAIDSLHWAAGAGLRYRTLIGPVRFDLAYRLNKRGAGNLDADEPIAFHFSLGEAF